MGYFISLVVLAIFLLILRIKNKNLTIAKDKILELEKSLVGKKETIDDLEYKLGEKHEFGMAINFLNIFLSLIV